MPAISIKEGEPAVPLEKAITLRDFLTITRDVDKALLLMRKTCIEGKDLICATYKDQIAHYMRMMLTSRGPGEREPVESMLRRMGPEEFEAVKDIEALWERAIREYPEITEAKAPDGSPIGRAGPEFLEEELVQKWEERLGGLIGPVRWKNVKGIQWGVMGGPPPRVEKTEEELAEMIESEEEKIRKMKEELRHKMERVK